MRKRVIFLGCASVEEFPGGHYKQVIIHFIFSLDIVAFVKALQETESSDNKTEEDMALD